MPIYEYQCRDCKKVSEFLVGVNQNKSEIICGYCGSKKLEKMMSAGFVGKAKKENMMPCAASGMCPGAGGCSGHGGCAL